MKKSDLKYLIPFAVFMASPWVHKIVCNNILMAWPEALPDTVHIVAILGFSICFGFTAIWKLNS